MRTIFHALPAMLVIACSVAWAQQPPPDVQMHEPRPPEGDIMAQHFFPPELVMQHQKAIGLKEEQRLAIKTEMQKVLSRFTELQWQQHAEQETMASLLRQQTIDEKQVLTELDKLLTTENEMKRAHVGLLIKVKNTLTPEQQAKLTQLRKQGAFRPASPGPGLPGPPRERPSPPIP